MVPHFLASRIPFANALPLLYLLTLFAPYSGKGVSGKGGKGGKGGKAPTSKKAPLSRSARAGLQVSGAFCT